MSNEVPARSQHINIHHIKPAFKAGVEFAESKFESILKDFADYLGIETDGSLITQFIKDRNEV